LPGWQIFYHELKDKNFEIVSVAQDTGGVKDASPWIEKANPEYIALIDEQHLVTKLYGMVNVPTAVWINEQGKIVRPNEVAFVDDRFKSYSHMDSGPYLEGIRDWVAKGERSSFVLSEEELRKRLTPVSPDRLMADAEFSLAEYLYHAGHGPEAIPHFKQAQRLAPDNWNYKRQAWLLSDPDRDYGTNFAKEVQKLNGKPYYAPRQMPEAANKPN
jgi:tetratricopeptide (TPR) repeat protein